MSLQVVASKCEEAPNRFTKSVEEVTESLNTSVNSLLQHTISEMFNAVNQDCPHVLNHKVSWTRHCTQEYIATNKNSGTCVSCSLLDRGQITQKLEKNWKHNTYDPAVNEGFFSLLLPPKMSPLSLHWDFFSASMYYHGMVKFMPNQVGYIFL